MPQLTKPTTLAPREIERVKKQLEQLERAIKTLEKLGIKVPPPLRMAVKALRMAIETGIDLGKNADAAAEAYESYMKNLRTACEKLRDEGEKLVCEVKVERVYRAVGFNFTLNKKNKASWVARDIETIIKKLTPEKVCKYWKQCAKIDKKK